jgi:hypothetical protein
MFSSAEVNPQVFASISRRSHPIPARAFFARKFFSPVFHPKIPGNPRRSPVITGKNLPVLLPVIPPDILPVFACYPRGIFRAMVVRRTDNRSMRARRTDAA